jgi:hypothetical protein
MICSYIDKDVRKKPEKLLCLTLSIKGKQSKSYSRNRSIVPPNRQLPMFGLMNW